MSCLFRQYEVPPNHEAQAPQAPVGHVLAHLPLNSLKDSPEGFSPKGSSRTSQSICSPLPSVPLHMGAHRLECPPLSLPTTCRAPLKCHLLLDACQDSPPKSRTNSLCLLYIPGSWHYSSLTIAGFISHFRGYVVSSLRAPTS